MTEGESGRKMNVDDVSRGLRRPVILKMSGIHPCKLSKKDQKRLLESFDASALEKYLKKTFTYDQLGVDVADFAREWTRSQVAVFDGRPIPNFTDPSDPSRWSARATAKRKKEQFSIYLHFNEDAQIVVLSVVYDREPIGSNIKTIWEMTDEELLERRELFVDYMRGMERRLHDVIDKEIERRGLSVEPFRSIYGSDRATATSSHRS